MTDIGAALGAAFSMIVHFDRDLAEIVGLSSRSA